MTAEQGPDQGRQRTVAELLEQYGEGRSGAPRRRRRAADDEPSAPGGDQQAGYPGPDASAALPDYDPGASAALPGYDPGASAALPGYDPGASAALPGYDPGAHRAGGYGLGEEPPANALFSGSGQQALVPEQRWASEPAVGQSIHPLTGEPIDPPTERFPRFLRRDDQATDTDGPMTGPMTGPLTGPVTGDLTGPLTGVGADIDEGPPTGRVSSEALFAEADPDSEDGPSAAPAGLAERDESGAFAEPDENEPRRLGVKGWIGLVVQWLLGAVGGALLWVGFSYLWRHYPIVALTAAPVAILGLVLVVRALRRRDDVQTFMLAVLVGLVVTISPAVLLYAVG